MWHADSRPLPEDRHVCVIYLSRAGKALDDEGHLMEAEPSPRLGGREGARAAALRAALLASR